MSPTDNDILIMDYSSDYSDEVTALLDELQRHIVSLDPYHIQSFGEGYHTQYLASVEQTVSQSDGKMFIALKNNVVIGFTAGAVDSPDEIDRLTTACPTKGRILELIVSKEYRGSGAGHLLMEAIENYLSSKGCDFIYVDVFASNSSAADFYRSLGFEQRNIELIKKQKNTL